MIFGTFDILHPGHIDLFTQAKKLGDSLTVVVARDHRVANLKKDVPVHTEQERMNLLKHIDLIDTAIMGNNEDVYKVIQDNQPDIIALGYDQTHYTDKLEQKIKEFGLHTKVIRLKPYKQDTHKSTIIKQKILSQT